MKCLRPAIFGLTFSLLTPAFSAADLQENLKRLMQESPRSRSSQAELEANHHRKQERNSRLRAPNFTLDTNYGPQTTESFGQNPVREDNARGFNARLSQLLMDFGQSSAALDESEYIKEQSRQALHAAKQGLLLEALTAYLSVQRADEVLKSARKAEDNIKEQARLENAMIEAGKGYRSDVLHAKAQLASAQARRVRAEGALEVAKARVKAVFGVVYDEVRFHQNINLKSLLMPKTLNNALEVAQESNYQLKIGNARSTALQHRLKSVRLEENAPKVEAVAQIERNWDADGVLRRKRDDRFMLKITWDNNLGNAETHRIASVRKDLEASEQRELETSQLVEEQVRIAWRNLETARLNQTTIANQVELARQFLDASRKERRSGRRSLLDVLSAETRLTDAEADLAATEFDLKIAAFTLLQAVGLLNEESVVYQNTIRL